MVLLTGFGPFPGVAANATTQLVPRLANAARARFPEFEFACEILPTEWEAGPARLAALLDELQPVLALHFGVSERVVGFQVERTARNERGHIADACGALPGGACVADAGPETIQSTFPADLIVERLRALGVPVVVSDDAGSYLCNAVLYQSLSLCGGPGQSGAVGFVHVPARLGEAGCALDWDKAVRGGVEIIATCLELAPTRA